MLWRSSARTCCIPSEPRQQTYIQQALADREGPFIAATDYMKTVADQIRQWVPGRYAVLGTDGFGRSDSRAELRRFFEVDRHYVAIAALKALADEGKIDMQTVTRCHAGVRHRSGKTQSPVGLGGTVANPIEVLVPDIGGFKDVSVIDVLVKDGQQIEKETPLDHDRNRKGGDGRAIARRAGESPRSSSSRATRFPKAP